MQGAEELCVLLLSSNRNISYTKSAENNQPLSFKKKHKKDMGMLPFLWKLRDLKTGQFKVDKEQVPAELC